MKKLMVVVIAVTGCAGPSVMSPRMHVAQPVTGADPASALVVFLKPSNRVAASAIIDASGAALGEIPGESALVVPVPPGPHTFVKAMYRDPEGGNFSLFGHLLCNQLSGTFDAGKIYFVEVSMFRLFALKPGDPRLASWAAGQQVAISQPASVTADPEWQPCLGQARENAEKESRKGDARSVINAADGLSAWPR